MNHFNLPKGLLDSVTSVLKTSPKDNTPLQEKLIKANQSAVKATTEFDSAVASVVAEGRKKEAERQAKFMESAAKAHKGMGKSIVESAEVKQEVVEEEFILAESAFAELATRMKNVGNARRMQNMTEQKETIAQMTRTFMASFDQIVESNIAEMSQDVILALAEAKAEIRTQMLNAVNVASAARVVDESAKIMAFISVQEALKGKQHKIDANKNGKIDAHDFEVLKSRKARAQGEAVDEQAQPVEEGWDDMVAAAKDTLKDKPKPNGGSGIKKGKSYGNQKNASGEGKEVKEGVMSKVKSFAKKALEKVGGGSDEDQLKRLQKNMGVAQTGKKPDVKEELEAVVEAMAPKKEKEPEGLYSSKRFETDSQRIARLAKEKRQAAKAAVKEEAVVEQSTETSVLSAAEADRIAQIAKDMGL